MTRLKNTRKASLEVEQIRKIAPFLRKTSSEGGWRVVIIDDADTMNRNAQNALLKILEEPPAKTVIMLVTHRAGALIPTIKSRSQTMHFNPLNREILADLLNKTETPPAPEQKDTLIDMAEGSIGKAITLIEEEGTEMLQTVLSLLQADKPDWKTIHKTADSLARVGQNKAYSLFQTTLTHILWYLCQSKARGTPLPSYLQSAAALQSMLNTRTLENLVTLTDTINDHFDRSNHANLDKKSTILQAITLMTHNT